MEKFEQFKPDEETIESWLDGFEARFLQTVQDSEKLEEGKVLSIAREQEKPKENRVDLEHVVEECFK